MKFRLLLLLVLLIVTVRTQAQIRAHYINVGQADSILLEFRTAAILIDAGGESVSPPNENRDRDHLMQYLTGFFGSRPDLNGNLLAVIITHPHIDHTKNLMAVMQQFRVQNLFDGGNTSGSGIGPLKSARAFAKSHHIRYTVLRDEMINTTDGMPVFQDLRNSSNVDLRILAAARGCDNANNDSLVVRVQSGNASYLFTGDAEVEGDGECEGEVPMLLDFYDGTRILDVDVYKVGHHGSFNGTNEDFMRAMSPKISVLSSGIHTQHGPGGFHAFQFGHPREVTVALLEEFDSANRTPAVDVYSMTAVRRPLLQRHITRGVFCTCWDGDIRISSNADGAVLRVQTSGRPDGQPPIN